MILFVEAMIVSSLLCSTKAQINIVYEVTDVQFSYNIQYMYINCLKIKHGTSVLTSLLVDVAARREI